MHCRDCGAELLSPDRAPCRSCGARLDGAAAGGDDYTPGLPVHSPLRGVALLAVLAVLAAATAIVSAAV